MKKDLVKLSSGNNVSRSSGFGGGYSGSGFSVHRHSKSCLLSSRNSPLTLVMFAGDFPLLMMFGLNSRRVVGLQANVFFPWEIIIQALSFATWTSFCSFRVCHCKPSRKTVRIAATAGVHNKTICASEALGEMPSAFGTDTTPGVAVKTGTAVTEGVAVGTGVGRIGTGVTVRDWGDKLCKGLEEGVALGPLSSLLGVGVELLSSPLPRSASLVANEKKANANAVKMIRGKSTNLLMQNYIKLRMLHYH